MEVLCEVIILLLKGSKCRPVSFELVKKEARLPTRVLSRLLRRLQDDGLVYLHGGFVEIGVLQRLRLAVYALQLGADYERVSDLLGWREFEETTAAIFEAEGYIARTNLRFGQSGQRWEIDVVACRKPLAVCVDCKHWRRGLYPSRLKKVADEQARRTLAFSRSLPSPAVRVDCASWNEVKFIPVVLSLTSPSLKFHNRIPLVAVLQLRDFLAQLPMHVDSLKHFDKTQAHFKIVS